MEIEMDKKLAIVIPVWNQWAYTKRALQDLAPLPADHLLIIVDNGSVDNTKSLKSFNKVEVIRNTKNLGFAFGSNQGYECAVDLGFENVMFLNNDIRVVAEVQEISTWTEPLIKQAKQGKIVGPTVGYLDDQFNFVKETNKIPDVKNWYMSGWNLTASVETWKKLIVPGSIGPFNQAFKSYFEDTDLSFRAKQLGIEMAVVDVPVKHIGRVTGKAVGLNKQYLISKKIFLNLWGKNE
jgi:GT2 family glycosyltransferase